MYRGKFNVLNEDFDVEKCIIEAGKGNCEAQESLALCYIYGVHGIKEDEAKGFQLALESARKGLPEGLYLLGECYECGYGIEPDAKKAFDYYEKAAKKDYTLAICDLGNFYLNGIGVEQDLKKGEKLLKKAVDRDYSPAIVPLADYYYDIDEKEKAVKILERGKELGDPEAQTFLGLCYFSGIGTAADEEKAFSLIQEAAEKYKYGDALYYLSKFYTNGIVVENDPAKAKYYYQLALENGYKPKRKSLEDYFNEETEGDIEIPQEGSINYITDKEKIQTCVVYIESDTGCGSGFIISPNGYVATCAHVVSDARKLHIKLTDENNNKKTYKGTIIKLNEVTDTAIIKIDNAPSLPFIELDEREEPALGEDIVLYGYPLGDDLNDSVFDLNVSFNKGYVSSNQVYKGIKVTMLDIAAKHGNSGGPLISCKTGKVIGTLTARVPFDDPGDIVIYMHPICYLKELIEEKPEPEQENEIDNPSGELASQEPEEIPEEKPDKKESGKFWKWMKIGAIVAGGAILGAVSASKKNK